MLNIFAKFKSIRSWKNPYALHTHTTHTKSVENKVCLNKKIIIFPSQRIYHVLISYISNGQYVMCLLQNQNIGQADICIFSFFYISTVKRA